MKNAILLFLLIISIGASSQTIYPLLDTNKVWSNIRDENGSSIPPPYEMKTTFIRLSSDTVLNGSHFYRVLATEDSLQLNYIDIGRIWIDSTAKVFYKENGFGAKQLYDFRVKLGDTIVMQRTGSYQHELVVDTIDSIYVYNSYRVRYILSPLNTFYRKEYWVEGIGSIYGFLTGEVSWLGGVTYRLLCYYENDTMKYSSPDYNECYYNTVGIENNDNQNISVSLMPNPVVDISKIKIKNYQTGDCNLQIYDLNGKIVLASEIIDGEYLINKSDLGTGIFFYRITSNNNQQLTGKIIIQ